ncbi:hypothetical protein BDR04DRAFT_1110217 [Suillus decipiens]|nr:hypothetical protein BDR04DRAFT_1110217 [Suillus decipiens]
MRDIIIVVDKCEAGIREEREADGRPCYRAMCDLVVYEKHEDTTGSAGDPGSRLDQGI